MSKRADLYCGIGQAVNELTRLQRQLMAFGYTEEQQLLDVEYNLKEVGYYLLNTDKMYKFDDLAVTVNPTASNNKQPETDSPAQS